MLPDLPEAQVGQDCGLPAVNHSLSFDHRCRLRILLAGWLASRFWAG